MKKWIFKLQTNEDTTTEQKARFLTIWTANKKQTKNSSKELINLCVL